MAGGVCPHSKADTPPSHLKPSGLFVSLTDFSIFMWGLGKEALIKARCSQKTRDEMKCSGSVEKV